MMNVDLVLVAWRRLRDRREDGEHRHHLILIMVVVVVGRKDRRGDGKHQCHLVLVMVVVVGKRMEWGQRMSTSSHCLVFIIVVGGGMGEGTVSINVDLSMLSRHCHRWEDECRLCLVVLLLLW